MEATLSSYEPTWRDRVAQWMLGDQRPTAGQRSFVSGLLGSAGTGSTGASVADLTPIGGLLSAQENAQRGDYKGAALAMLPMPAAKAKGFIAYHGSPHSFDRFDISKIGTGEGAQAYGHGLYFADKEAVAEEYRNALRGPVYSVGGKEYAKPIEATEAIWNMADLPEKARYEAGWHINRNYPLSDALQHLEKNSPEDFAALKAAMDAGKIAEVPNPGSMYQVRINADPEHFLDWDKPLSEHPEAIRRKLGWTPEAEAQYHAAQSAEDDALLAALDGDGGGYTPSKIPVPAGLPALNKTGADIVRGGSVFDRASDVEKATKLREAGIPGIKYLDQGSRAAGDGSRNYVVFDDSLIEILKKYGLVGLLGGGAAMGASQSPNAQQGAPLL